MSESTLVCHPDRYDSIRAALDADPALTSTRLVTSLAVEVGQVLSFTDVQQQIVDSRPPWESWGLKPAARWSTVPEWNTGGAQTRLTDHGDDDAVEDPDDVRSCDQCGATCDMRIGYCECDPSVCPYPAVQ